MIDHAYEMELYIISVTVEMFYGGIRQFNHI